MKINNKRWELLSNSEYYWEFLSIAEYYWELLSIAIAKEKTDDSSETQHTSTPQIVNRDDKKHKFCLLNQSIQKLRKKKKSQNWFFDVPKFSPVLFFHKERSDKNWKKQ